MASDKNLQKRKKPQDVAHHQQQQKEQKVAASTNQKGKIIQNQQQSSEKGSKKKEVQEIQGGFLQRFMCYMFEEMDASYLIVFRILWGIIMAYEALTYMLDDFSKVQASFYSQIFSFKYYGFEWCVIPEDQTYINALMVALFILGINITIGEFLIIEYIY
jgi:hypothetical protein